MGTLICLIDDARKRLGVAVLQDCGIQEYHRDSQDVPELKFWRIQPARRHTRESRTLTIGYDTNFEISFSPPAIIAAIAPASAHKPCGWAEFSTLHPANSFPLTVREPHQP